MDSANIGMGWGYTLNGNANKLQHTMYLYIDLGHKFTTNKNDDMSLGGRRNMERKSSEIHTDTNPSSGLKPGAKKQQHYLLRNRFMHAKSNL